MTEIVALFESQRAASRAIDALDLMGYDIETMGFLAKDTGEDTVDGAGPQKATEGAVTEAQEHGGKEAGPGAGLVAAAGLAMIPDAGAYLAAGNLLASLEESAGEMRVARTILNAENDINSIFYRQGVDEGGAMITVEIRNEETPDVMSMLRDAGAQKINVHEAGQWA